MPYIPSADSIRLAGVEAWVESDAPLSEYDVGVPTSEAQAIAATIAAYVRDGAAIQIGLGKVPDALLRYLTERRKLRLFSGMLSDGARSLVESGSLDSDFAHTCCVHVGTRSYYEWLRGTSFFGVRGCDVTHSVAHLSSMAGLVAVNSAVSVDLFGQVNLEMIAGRGVSGLGGAPDFARGAVAAKDGISIIALPSTSGKAALSRVVPLIDGVCSLPRCDIDIIVTEHGAADLRNCSALERGKRIIQVAAPQHRAALAETFHQMVRKF
jgi:acyl-CoA hydrolase